MENNINNNEIKTNSESSIKLENRKSIIPIPPPIKTLTSNNQAKEEKIINSIVKREEMSAEKIKEAKEIGFKDTPDKIYDTDQFGFLREKQ